MLDKVIIVLIGLQIFFRSSFFDSNMLPYLNIGGASSLGLHDLSFFILLIVLFFKMISAQERTLRWNVHTWFLTIFLFLGLVGVVNASVTGTGFHLAAREARYFFVYMLYFAVLLLSPTENNIKKITAILVVITVVTSIFALIEVVAGDQIAFLFGKVTTLRTLGDDVEGVTRVSSGGLASINLVFFIYFAFLLHKIDKKNLLLFSIFSIAIFISFNRGTWLSILLAIFALYPFMEKKLKAGNIKTFILLGGAGALLFIVGAFGGFGEQVQNYSNAGIARFTSLLPGHIEGDGSTMDRFTEAEIVFEKYKQRPWIGHGLGAITQDYVAIDGKTQRSWGYVHNGYLYVLFKLGAIGLFVFILFIITFIIRSIKGLKLIHDSKLKAIYFGSLLFIVSIIPHSIPSPRIMEGKYITVICIALGLIELIRLYSLKDEYKKANNNPPVVDRSKNSTLILRQSSSSDARILRRKP